MPRLAHEALVQLVRRTPELVPALLWPGEQPRTTTTIHVTATEVVDVNLAERNADVVLAIGGTPGRPDRVVVVEVQTEIDASKRDSWPFYVAGLRARFRCPTVLVVIALDRRVARWSARPIDLGFDRCMLFPWVLGADDIPVIADAESARAAPELAILSLAAHAGDPGGDKVALAAFGAASELDRERRSLYATFILGLLGRHARAILEKYMSTAQRQFYSDILQEQFEAGLARGKAEGKAEGQAEGLAKGKAELLLKLLALKNLAVSAAEREQILGCTDPDLLDTWAARVLTATRVDEVFGEAR